MAPGSNRGNCTMTTPGGAKTDADFSDGAVIV